MNKKSVMSLTFLTVLFSMNYAMEEKPIIEPTSPRLWVKSLHNFKNDDNNGYVKFLNEVIKLINTQPVSDQLKLYTTMIDAAIETSDAVLIVFLDGYFEELYSEHFQGTVNEHEIIEIIKNFKNKMLEKDLSIKALNFSRLSTTGALPPLKEEESNEIMKRLRSSTDDFNNAQILSQTDIDTTKCTKEKTQDYVVFGSRYTTDAVLFSKNKLVTAAINGPVSVYEKTGERVFESKKKVKGLVPFLIIPEKIETINPHLKVHSLGSEHAIVYALDGTCAQCLLLNGRLIMGASTGLIVSEHLIKKKMLTLQEHSGKVSALCPLGKFTFLSGSVDGTIKRWSSKKKKSKMTIEESKPIKGFTKFGSDYLALCDNKEIKLVNIKEARSTLLIRSDDCLKSILGYNKLLIAGLKNGSLQLWHKDYGFCKNASVCLQPPARLNRMASCDDDLYCFYKNGEIIKFSYAFLLKKFEDSVALPGTNDMKSKALAQQEGYRFSFL